MHVKHVKVTGFRGIASLDWTVGGNVVGLVGPGDSTKTTILDAIEYALFPRWSVPISDSDFYGGRPDLPIMIEITVGDCPDELLRDEKHGLQVRGWRLGSIVDEPDDDCEPVLTIRLTVQTDLEPLWTVVTNRHPEGYTITSRDRARLGVVRLGAEVHRDLSWGKGSALSRMTGSVDVESVLAEAYRVARATVAETQLPRLADAAEAAARRARQFGVHPASGYMPALDSVAMSVTAGALSLHDGTVPVRAAGLGTRRLVALAIQQAVVPDGAILLIDEIEHGLEPHRIRRLLRHLRGTTARGDGEQTDRPRHGQVIMTTHSPVVVQELDAHEIRVVRSAAGATAVRLPTPEFQGVLRALSEAFLAKRVVVCEGATEVGLCWGMEDYWKERHSGESMACHGVAFVNGTGSEGPRRAMALARLGYEVAYFADSDTRTNPSVSELFKVGVHVICWDGSACTEQRVFSDLPWTLVQDAFDLAIAECGEDKVMDPVASLLGLGRSSLTTDLDSWQTATVTEQRIREVLGKAAKGSKDRPAWYKRTDRGEHLAQIIVRALPTIQDSSDLGRKFKALESWCYA